MCGLFCSGIGRYPVIFSHFGRISVVTPRVLSRSFTCSVISPGLLGGFVGISLLSGRGGGECSSVALSDGPVVVECAFGGGVL